MTDGTHANFLARQPEDDAAREERHQALASLLGAYADGELPLETSSQIDAHLLGCTRCRNELHVQHAISQKLSRSVVPLATTQLQDKIRARLAVTPFPVLPEPQNPALNRSRQTWIVATITVIALASAFVLKTIGNDLPTAQRTPVVVSDTVPSVSTMFDAYRRIVESDLPGRARDLDAVRGALPFTITPLTAPELHLLGTWTTSLDGAPAAVLAYRWNDVVIFQFVIDEPTLFRAHESRQAFAAGRIFASQSDSLGLVAWPEQDAGSVIVGALPWIRLMPLVSGTVP